ncbi:MAG: ATP-binding protein [Candidatus Binatia bacterium]
MGLRLAVPLLVMAVGLMVASLFVFIELRQTNARAVAAGVRQLDVLCGVMVEDIEKKLRRGQPINVHDTLRPVRGSRNTEAALLVDDADRVMHSTERSIVGLSLDRTPFADEKALVDTARRQGRPVFRRSNNGGRLFWAHPFALPPRPGELISTRSGVLLVQSSLDIPWNHAVRDAFSRTGTALVMLALLCILVSWGFHRSFTPRIDALVEATERIAAGDYHAVAAVGGADELSRLGQAISEMASRLESEHSNLLRSEADLRKLNAELEERVRERTEESAAYARDMESFAYTISHDLRAPLRSIAGFAQILVHEHAARLGPDGMDHLVRVMQNAKKMSRLIDDILAFSRQGRQPVNAVEVDVSALARSVAAELLGQQADASRLDVRIDETPTAVADEGLLRQVLHNLLSNAIKYSAPRDRVEIHVGAEKDPRGTVYFVADNGIGFDMEYAGKVFGAFQRLHAPDEYDGTGVGLAIVKRILEHHGGSVWVRSSPGAGSTFYFAFFAAEEATGLPPAAREGGAVA